MDGRNYEARKKRRIRRRNGMAARNLRAGARESFYGRAPPTPFSSTKSPVLKPTPGRVSRNTLALAARHRSIDLCKHENVEDAFFVAAGLGGGAIVESVEGWVQRREIRRGDVQRSHSRFQRHGRYRPCRADPEDLRRCGLLC